MTLDVGPQTSTFSGNVRGYWFTAPVDFWIHGLFVPTDASSGDQSVELLRFNSGPPPNWSSTTNDFESLFRAVGVAGTDPIATNIFVSAGDVIGVLGWRGTTNSYGTGSYGTTIFGNPVTLARMGMQYDLNTTPAQDVWTEPGGSISRVELIYDSVPASEVPEPSTLTLLAAGMLLLYKKRALLGRG